MILSKIRVLSVNISRGLSLLREIPNQKLRNQVNFLASAVNKNSIRQFVNLQSNDNQKFLSIFTEVLKDIQSKYPDSIYPNANFADTAFSSDFDTVKDHVVDIIKYNTKGGKYIRGYLFLLMYKIMEDPQNLTPENISLANIMAWCLEIRHGGFIIMDDLLDQSISRRGQICWYRNKDIGLSAVHDFYLTESVMQFLLQKYFSQHPSYMAILDIFYHTKWMTYLGQTLDLNTVDKNGPKLDLFSMEIFETTAICKTGYYTFLSPLSLSMKLANCLDEKLHHQIEDIAKEFGILYQKQDDYLDCFGNFADSGKHGTDIQEGKCTWFIVKALEKANSMQRKLLQEHYGKKDDVSVKVVYNLYNELDLSNEFLSHENEEIERIRVKIGELSRELPRNLFYGMLLYIFKRKF